MKIARNSFTLIELLVVMAVIALLSAITLGAAGAIQNKAARSRAGAEIAAISTALESYKTDNGIYPGCGSMPAATDGYSAGTYKNGATNLFVNLNGGIPDLIKGSSATFSGPVYMTFKKSQVDSTVSCGVQDPFGYYYGYCTNAPTSGMNAGFFDLWSTSGKTDTTSASLAIRVNNWSAN